LIPIFAILTIAISLIYSKVYYPSLKKYQTYIAQYYEYDTSEINNISISSTNYTIKFVENEEDKIKVMYYQKNDNTNIYTVNKGLITLSMSERTEKISNLFFKSEKEIGTIVVYLPKENNVTILVEGIDTKLEVNNVSFKSLTFHNAYGDISFNNTTSPKVTLSINSGDIVLNDCQISNLNISSVSGDIQIGLLEPIEKYNASFKSIYGYIKLNEEILQNQLEDGTIENAKEYQNSSQEKNSFVIQTTRSCIDITYPILTEENNQEENKETPPNSGAPR